MPCPVLRMSRLTVPLEGHVVSARRRATVIARWWVHSTETTFTGWPATMPERRELFPPVQAQRCCSLPADPKKRPVLEPCRAARCAGCAGRSAVFRCGIFRIGVMMTRSGSDVRILQPAFTGCEAVERPEPAGEASGRRAVGGAQSWLTLGVRDETLHGSCGSSTRPWLQARSGAGRRGVRASQSPGLWRSFPLRSANGLIALPLPVA